MTWIYLITVVGTMWYWSSTKIAGMTALGWLTSMSSMFAWWLGGAIGVLVWNTVGLKVACWLESWGCWIAAQVIGWIIPWVLPAMQSLPSMGGLTGTWWQQAWCVADYFVPLSEAMVGFALTFTFVAVFRVLRFGKQFVPTASN